MAECHQCSGPIKSDAFIGRTDECASCGADLHVCLNCDFRDPNCENECREPSAERVVEKDRSNFCDYFRLGAGANKEGAEDARARFQSLFKK